MFALSPILGPRNVKFRCFDLRFKENALCHPAFVIRDINICRNSYSQGRLKSRKSYHCCKCYTEYTDFLQNLPQSLPPFLSTLSGTIREAMHDVVAKLMGVTADFSTSKLNTERSYKRQGRATLKHFVGFFVQLWKAEMTVA